jgi:tetratricopeptide (TPR) repeat protein
MSFRDISLGSKIDKNVISFLEKQSIKVELPVSPTNDNPSQLPGSSSLTSSAQPKGPLTGFPAMTTGSLSPLAENPPQIDETSQAARKPTLHIPLFRENGSLDLTRDTPGRSQQVQPIELSSPPASPHLSISSEGNPRPRKLGRRPYENEKQELADDYYQSGELQKAKVLYQETLSITKRESYTQVFHKKRIETSLTCRIAEICVLQGHYDEAFNEFTELEKQARIEHPEQREQALEIMRWLGITLDRQGKYSEANDKLAEVEKLLVEATSDQHEDLEKRSPDSTTAFMATKMALSMVAAHKGNFMNAISASNEAEVLAKEEKNDKKLGTIIFNKAAICAYHGYYAEADTHSQEALENMQRNLGPKHVKTLDCLGLRVALLLVEGSIGSLDKAENLCRRTLIRMRREIGAEHPLTLQTLETQAKIYKAQGRLTDALDVAKYVCDKNRAHRGIGPRHPQMLGSMSTLATIYSARGQLNMALSQQEEVVRMAIAEESPLGKHHVTTLQLLSEQASIHAVRGEWELSKNLALEVFNQQCRKFVGDRYGEKYIQQIPVIDPLDYQSLLTVGKRLGLTEIPTIEFESDFSLPLLSVLNCIGVLERELGNIERSRQILQKVLDDRSRRTKRFTQNHRDTLESKFELAKTIRQLGDLPGAESEFAMIVKERSINLGADHPDTLCAAHELSMTRFQIGHTEDSARELEIIFHARFDLLGQNHPDTIKSQVSLAEVNYALGDFQAIESAKEYQLSALESQIQTSELRELDQFSGIKKQLYEDAIDRCHFPNSVKSNTWAVEDERLPKYHRQNGSGMLEPPYCPDIISGMTNLASIYAYYRHYGDTEMLEKAVQLQRAVYVLQKEYPDHHISILQTMNDLALMHQSLGDIVEAIHLFKNIGRTIEPCDPLHFTSKSNLASLYFSEKDLKEAEKLQTEVLDQWLACKANDQDPRGTVMYQFNLALTKSELGKRDPRKKKEAIELLEKALGLSTSCSINEKEIKRLLEILGSRPHERNGKANGGQ